MPSDPKKSSRRTVIGMDEAGYGPKLGPLVIAVSVWTLPEEMTVDEMWKQLDNVLTNEPHKRDLRLHVGDSKEVYSSTKGIAALERSVLSLIASCHEGALDFTQADDFFSLLPKLLGTGLPASFAKQPWYDSGSLPLPLKARQEDYLDLLESVNRAFQNCQVRIEHLQVEVVCPERFNSLIQAYGNKSELLTRLSMSLVQQAVPPDSAPCEILADKHGGRSRYLSYLMETFPNRFFLTEKESQEQSRYRSGELSLTFSVKSERYLPVAVASMAAKYVRELCMEAFNRYWQKRCPTVKPIKGYPVDAARFRKQIEPAWEALKLPETILWRER